MKELEALRGMDIYFLDQLMKGNVRSSDRILDAGCGSGRNSHYLLNHGFDVTGIDPQWAAIEGLRALFPDRSGQFIQTTIADFTPENPFDFIICNAVLHFSADHAAFDADFNKLVSFLAENGRLFIRMTSTIGLDLPTSSNGVYLLPDGSTRYLITRERITKLCAEHDLQLIEPVKTVKVEELRTMTTIVFQKKDVIYS